MLPLISPKNVCLIHGTYEYFTFHGKEKLRLNMEINLLISTHDEKIILNYPHGPMWLKGSLQQKGKGQDRARGERPGNTPWPLLASRYQARNAKEDSSLQPPGRNTSNCYSACSRIQMFTKSK